MFIQIYPPLVISPFKDSLEHLHTNTNMHILKNRLYPGVFELNTPP